jgi:hypothetical protein
MGAAHPTRGNFLTNQTKTMNDELITIEESKRLIELESVIQTRLDTFMDVGNALAEIRDSKLYRIEHKTFEDYCREKWGMKRGYANYLVRAAEVVKSLPAEMVTIVTTESQARELASVEPGHREEVLTAAVEATGGNLTAAAIKEAALERAEHSPQTLLPQEPETTKDSAPSEGMAKAERAIKCLETINHNDVEKRRAYKAVSDWLKLRK